MADKIEMSDPEILAMIPNVRFEATASGSSQTSISVGGDEPLEDRSPQTVRMVSFENPSSNNKRLLQTERNSKPPGSRLKRSSTLGSNVRCMEPKVPLGTSDYELPKSTYFYKRPHSSKLLSSKKKSDKFEMGNRKKITEMRSKNKQRKIQAQKNMTRRRLSQGHEPNPKETWKARTSRDMVHAIETLRPSFSKTLIKERASSVGDINKRMSEINPELILEISEMPKNLRKTSGSQTYASMESNRGRLCSFRDRLPSDRDSKHALHVPAQGYNEFSRSGSNKSANSDGISEDCISEASTMASPRFAALGKKKCPDAFRQLRKILSISPKSRKDEHLKTLAEAFEKLGVTFQNFSIEGDAAFTRWQKITMKRFCRNAKSRIYPEGAKIFSQGDESDKFYVILSGSVDVRLREALNGITKTVATLVPGMSFGDLGIVHNEKRSATIMAKERTELIEVDKRNYKRIFEREPERANKNLKFFTDEKGTALSLEQRIDKAAMFIDDARHQRDFTHVRVTFWAIRVNSLLNSVHYSVILLLVIMIQLSFILVEPPSHADHQWPSYKESQNLRLMAEWSVMAFWLFDLYLRIYRTSWDEFFRRTNKWSDSHGGWEWKHLALTIMYSLNLIDLLLFTLTMGSTFRFYRFLRPILLIFHFQGIEQTVRIAIHCTFQAKEFMLLFAIFQLIFGAVGMQLFTDSYDEIKFSKGE